MGGYHQGIRESEWPGERQSSSIIIDGLSQAMSLCPDNPSAFISKPIL